jgi:hypothetical protein
VELVLVEEAQEQALLLEALALLHLGLVEAAVLLVSVMEALY